jgi:hypothetical protein
MVLFALAGALESAKRDKTLSTISKLNSLVMAKYETYRTRRVPVNEELVANYWGYIDITAANYRQLPNYMRGVASVRVDVIHELMRMEMPDRYSDIQDDPVNKMKDANNNVTPMTTPSATMAYRAALPSAPNFHFEAAKCLYLLVSLGLNDPDVMSQFSEDEIARDSLDGMRYFVDGWGQPIFFVRWPAGFSSPLQPWNVDGIDALGNPISAANKVYPTTHDPFDPLKTHLPLDSSDPFWNPNLSTTSQVYPPLYPLILSGGPDRITDIYLNGIPNGGGTEFQYSKTKITTLYPNNPYVFVGTTWTNGGLFGMPADLSSSFTPAYITNPPGDGVDNTLDNITNHDMSETQ